MVAAGTWLDPYEIVSPLRAGEMGEVYRTKDTRMDRFAAEKAGYNDNFGTTEKKR